MALWLTLEQAHGALSIALAFIPRLRFLDLEMKKNTNKPQIAIYQSFGNRQKIHVQIEDENVWLSQKLIAELFDVDVRTVNEHLGNVYLEQELDEIATIRSNNSNSSIWWSTPG